jgi:ferric-dicitrate binding protein FerR (iron transport regulator)
MLLEVVLLSGKVEVDIKESGEAMQLLPNQKISYNKQTGDYEIAFIDVSEYALWKNDRLVMDNEELETIFGKMERWYNIKIIYDATLPLKSRHTITITSEPQEEILRLLSITMPITYKIEKDKVLIQRK